jgi:hypothetical protein
MSTKLELTISRLDWDQIENDGDTVIRYDHAASEDRYCQAVADELGRYFQDVECEVELSREQLLHGGYRVRWTPEAEGLATQNYIEAAIADVYGTFDWCVPAAGVLSIDNGRSVCTPEEAIAALPWEVIVNAMDDDIREQVHMAVAPCSELEYLVAYLKFGSIVIG